MKERIKIILIQLSKVEQLLRFGSCNSTFRFLEGCRIQLRKVVRFLSYFGIYGALRLGMGKVKHCYSHTSPRLHIQHPKLCLTVLENCPWIPPTPQVESRIGNNRIKLSRGKCKVCHMKKESDMYRET